MIRFSQHIDSSWKFNYPHGRDHASFNEECDTSISEQIKEYLKFQDILVVDFLYQNYIKQFKGAILNEEDGFNSCFQVSIFLNKIFHTIEQKFLVLILTSDEDIIKWHYHLRVHGELRVQIIGPKTCPADFDEEHGLVLLLPHQEMKLAEALIDYPFFAVVMDHFDKIATKLIVRKLQGEFNIGISSRNFYIQPDQKLQWTMMNWSNSGFFGKLNNFYDDDNDNFSNLCDNYYPWWFTLTWKYSENIHRLSEMENLDYIKKLSSWADANGLNKNVIKIQQKRKRESKNMKKIKNHDNDKLKTEKDTKKIKGDINVESENVDSNMENNEDILENTCTPSKVEQKDIISDNITYDVIESHDDSIKHDLGDGLNVAKILNEDIILSIINEDETPEADEEENHQSQLANKKKEIMSDIFEDVSCSSRNEPNSEDSDFFLSLI